MKYCLLLLGGLLLTCSFVHAQVGIGTLSPEPSSALDISSTTQGMLTPRMSTAQLNAIPSPADGLLVYDTEVKAFKHYDAGNNSWEQLETSGTLRDNYVLVKSEADFPDPSGGRITLDPDTFYEINGTIVLSTPIDLNNAHVQGGSTFEDRLVFPGGTIFDGIGGVVRNVVLSAPSGTIFNVSGASAADSSLLLQNAVIADSGSVGTVDDFFLLFFNIVQIKGNSNGITYRNIDNLLLSNIGWFGDNLGTYETLIGDFDLVEKVSGFSQVVAATGAIGFDVTGITSMMGGGVLQSVVFYGGGTYVNGSSPYTGKNFDRNWTVNCVGIPVESDNVASANIYFNGDLTSGFAQSIASGTAQKIEGTGTFTANSLCRFTAPNTNRLMYDGMMTRDFQINAALSVRVAGAAGDFYAFIIAVNGAVVTESNSIVRIDSDVDIQNVALSAIVQLQEYDYVEIFVQRLTGSGTDTLAVFSENLTLR